MNNKVADEQFAVVQSTVQDTKSRYSTTLSAFAGIGLKDAILKELIALLVGLEDKIFATEPDGTLKKNKNGRPVISWLKVLSQLGFIVGRLAAVIIESKNLKQ